jgi:hypothetical protein
MAGSEREIGSRDAVDSPAPEVPEAVLRLAAERGLGPLVDVRRELSTSGALVRGAIGILAGLGVMMLVGWFADGVEGNGLVTALVRPIAIVGFVALVWGLIVLVRGLVVGSRAHYQFAGGLVAKRRTGLQAVAWPQVELLETRYNRQSRAVVGYRVQAAGGTSFMIPLVLVDNRDAFIDRIVDQLRAHGRPVR